MDKTGLTKKKVTEKDKAVPYFPDEIITNILIRLPAKDAMRCRLVCRRWRDLTLNRYFVDLHFRNSLPTVLFVAKKIPCSRLLICELDKWWEPATLAKPRLAYHINLSFVYLGEQSRESRVLFSHAGLIVCLEETASFGKEIVILNPARPDTESVSVTLSKELQGSEVYGVYYHPSLKGYCSLWKIGPSPNKFRYKILTLGPKPCLKTIHNPFSNRVKIKDAIPLLINNYLYWKLESEQEQKDGHNDIMKFDVLREEFMVIHCPVPLTTKCESRRTHLLNSDGVLSFLLVIPSKITIWRLDDHAEQVWTTTEYYFFRDIFYREATLDVIAIVKGKLAIRLYKTLHVCKLMKGRVVNPGIRICAKISYYSHQTSLASVSSGKTRIFIDQDDTVVVT